MLPRKIKEAAPDPAVDGELQFDAAVAPEVAKGKFAGSPVAGQANTFIFLISMPAILATRSLLVWRIRSDRSCSAGPERPINDLSRGCNAEEAYKMALVTAALSQADPE